MEALRAANRGMARAVCQGAKTAKRYAALGAGMEVDAQGYGREPTAMVRGVLSCLFVCLFLSVSSNVPILEKMSQIIVRRVVISHVLRTPIRDIQAHITRNKNKPCSFLPDIAYSFRMPTPV